LSQTPIGEGVGATKKLCCGTKRLLRSSEAALRSTSLYRNFNIFGRSQLLLAYERLCAAVHRQSPSGTAPTNRRVCNLNRVVWASDTRLRSHNARKYRNLQVQVANSNPQGSPSF